MQSYGNGFAVFREEDWSVLSSACTTQNEAPSSNGLLQNLNLASIKGVTSDTLMGLLPQSDALPPHPWSSLRSDVQRDEWDDSISSLEYLNLASTSIDDGVVPYISSCKRLRTLNVSKTRLSSKILKLFLTSQWLSNCTQGEALMEIVDACPLLDTLDLTSCRGIPLADRRRFFEVSSTNIFLMIFLVNELFRIARLGRRTESLEGVKGTTTPMVPG